MKLFLTHAIFENRAPFERLDLVFEENEIAVLSAVNGRGKTTILSHIVDAFHEIARPHFQGEYEGKENKFYRLSSYLENLDSEKPSIVYLRFNGFGNDPIDYINVRGSCAEAEYNNKIPLPNKIPFSEVNQQLELNGYAKKVSANADKKVATALFKNNVLTYFPAYRYETPGYLNDPYKITLKFVKEHGYAGRLQNPVEVVTGLPPLANWIMDVVLDMRVTSDEHSRRLFANLNLILTQMLTSKGYGLLRFGVGPRSLGGTRIQILTADTESKTIYPSIFNISSGESSMLCLFGELLRQADNIQNSKDLSEISGIVVIDEVDKHLHIKLQKEILPILFNLFPNIQFIVSSHSPFLSMGLAEVALHRSKIVDLETFGVSRDPTINELYSEVYRLMIGENDRFKELYLALEAQAKQGEIPLVITEGKTDVQHISAAKARLGIENCEIEFFDVPGDWGDTKLKLLLEQLSKVQQSRKIIGIFDRDVAGIVNEIEKDGRTYKDYGNNVYAFCIPIPPGRESYTNISIEFYFSEADLKKEKSGKRLFFDNEVEFRQSASRRSERTLTKLDSPKANEELTKRVFDENIGNLDWIISKAAFAELIEHDRDFAHDIDFNNFRAIFMRINEIILVASELEP